MKAIQRGAHVNPGILPDTRVRIIEEFEASHGPHLRLDLLATRYGTTEKTLVKWLRGWLGEQAYRQTILQRRRRQCARLGKKPHWQWMPKVIPPIIQFAAEEDPCLRSLRRLPDFSEDERQILTAKLQRWTAGEATILRHSYYEEFNPGWQQGSS
mgnify:FL=1